MRQEGSVCLSPLLTHEYLGLIAFMNLEVKPEALQPAYRWVALGVWLFSSISGFMVVNTIGILLPSISLDLQLSPAQQGILVSASFWGNLLLAVPMSWWVSRYGPKNLTTVTLGIGTICLFLQAWAPTFLALLVARLGFGVAIIAREPARALLIQQWFPKREFVLANSVSSALYGLIVGFGLVMTPLILGATGGDWRTTANIFATYYMGVTIVWVFLGKERVTPEYRRREIPREVGLLRGALLYRDLWVGGLGFMGATFAMSTFISFLPTLMLDVHQISLRWTGVALATGTFVGGAAGLGFGYTAAKKANGKGILQILGLLMAATYAAMTLTGSVPTLLALALFNGISLGFWPILQTVPFQLPGIKPREVAVALATTVMLMSMGTVLGPLTAGFLQAALGDLKLVLLIISFTPLSVSLAGTLLRMSTSSATAQLRNDEIGLEEERSLHP